MDIIHRSPDRPDSQDVAANLGLRRVELVRVLVGHGPSIAEVVGVAHRYPRRLRISLTAAARLAAAGVPLRIERRAASPSLGGGR
jgi:hypothetical protein